MTDAEFHIALVNLSRDPDADEAAIFDEMERELSVLVSVRARISYVNRHLVLYRSQNNVKAYRAALNIRKMYLHK